MAFNHIFVNTSSPKGPQLRNAVDDLESAIVNLRDIVAAMSVMVDFDADPDDYSHLEQQFGLEESKGQTAKSELESLLGKLDTDASVTNVKSAIQQVLNFFA